MPPPQEAYWRCRRFKNFSWHANCGWHSIRDQGDALIVETGCGIFKFDFIVFGTGFETDLSVRPELSPLVHHIALWGDRFTPPPGEENEVIAKHPYLGSAFEFTEKIPELLLSSAGCTILRWDRCPVFGITGGAVTGLKYGVPRLVSGLVRDLFREDAGALYQDFLRYSVPELESLEDEFTWVDRLTTEALSAAYKLLNKEGAFKSTKRSAKKRIVAPSTTKRLSTRSVKRPRNKGDLCTAIDRMKR